MISRYEARLVRKRIEALETNAVSEKPLSSFSLNHQASSDAELGDDTEEKFTILEDRIRENIMLTKVIH